MPPAPPCKLIPIDTTDFPFICELAAAHRKTVSVFDLETTTYIPTVKWFGITEIALLNIDPDGTARTLTSLVNPERTIPKKVIELTGITNEDVRGKPTWAVWRDYMDHVAANNLTVGYCSFGFDCPGVVGQNKRYGKESTVFSDHLDVFALPGVTGKLAQAAEKHGIVSDKYHRALADVLVTAKLLSKVAEKHGIDVIDAYIGQGPSPRNNRKVELLEHYAKNGTLPDLDKFARRHGIKRSTVEGDVLRMIENGIIAPDVLDRPIVQDWLLGKLENAIAEHWHGKAEGRLKPLMEALRAGAPQGFDYTQLRLALMHRRNLK